MIGQLACFATKFLDLKIKISIYRKMGTAYFTYVFVAELVP